MRATPAACAARFEPRELRDCRRLSTAAPPGSSPTKISALASAIASSVPKNSRCTGAIVVTIATCGRTSLRQRRDLARMVHADLEHAERRASRHQRERQRHAPVIVVGGGRRMRLALLAEHEPQRFLGAGLADRAGDRDDLRAANARARPARDRSAPPSTSSTTSSGASFGIAARLSRATTASPAPAFSAASTKSCPSRFSPWMAKNASPGLMRARVDRQARHVARQIAGALAPSWRRPWRRGSRAAALTRPSP